MSERPKRLCSGRLEEIRDWASRPDRAGPSVMWSVIDELLASHDWHRSMIPATYQLIFRSGIDRETDATAAWCEANGMHWESGDRPFERGWWTNPPGVGRLAVHLGAVPPLNPHTINTLAGRVGRAPLDVLDEIADLDGRDG